MSDSTADWPTTLQQDTADISYAKTRTKCATFVWRLLSACCVSIPRRLGFDSWLPYFFKVSLHNPSNRPLKSVTTTPLHNYRPVYTTHILAGTVTRFGLHKPGFEPPTSVRNPSLLQSIRTRDPPPILFKGYHGEFLLPGAERPGYDTDPPHLHQACNYMATALYDFMVFRNVKLSPERDRVMPFKSPRLLPPPSV